MRGAVRTVFLDIIMAAAALLLIMRPDAAAGATAPRIVTIGGAVTEIVFALGHGDEVVAVDQTSSFPPAIKDKPNVGYMRTLSAEGVLSLAPTLILATEGSGPPDTIAVLQRAAVPFVVVPEGYDAEAVLKKVRVIAKILGETERGEAMARAIASDFETLAAQRALIRQRRKAVFVLAIGSGAPTVGGSRTSADGLMALAGVDNALAAAEGFKPAVVESVLAAAPEVVLTMIERNHGMDAKTLFALPAFAGTPAARDQRLLRIPSSLLAFGPRTAHAAHELMAAIYPELKLEDLPPRPWTGDAVVAHP
ncbi:MAG TPA: ABC transporter substrate-binding protein [Xanthobacteraceae bacterium]|nr:ABC transporter substrate-binding protein [Xanthobacteraceae bacterium]